MKGTAKVIVLRTAGTNCDAAMKSSIEDLSGKSSFRHLEDLWPRR